MNEIGRSKIGELFADGAVIDKALRQAVQDALQRHRQVGLPIVEWREGQIVWTPPAKFPVQQPASRGRPPSDEQASSGG